jgi:predicted chitinase
MANVEFGSPRFKVPVMNDENTSEVTAVYFAKKILTPVYENTEETIVAKKGEDKKKIKARFVIEQKIKKEDLVDYAAETTFEKAKGGEKVTITYKKKVSDSISFKKITKAKIKEKVWVVATCNGTTGKLAVEINENKLTNTEAVYDNPVKFLIGEEEKTKIEFELFKDIIVTPNTYAKEITLQPKSKEDVKTLIDKFDKRTDKNAFLYFKAETIDPTYEIKIFEENKEFINKEGERFEILGSPCYCGVDFTVEEIKDFYKDDKGKFKVLFSWDNCPLPKDKKTYEEFTTALNKAMKNYQINTCLRKAHFLAQIEAETGFNTTLEKADGWDYDHTTYLDDYTNYKLFLDNKKEKANPYQKYDTKSIKSGYDKYLIRIKRGHNVKGYGPKYKGRGLIQLTWKDTYASYFDHINKATLIDTPEEVASDLDLVCDSAAWYWKSKSSWGNLNNHADKDDLIYVSVGVNGGLNGFDHRKTNLKTIINLMKIKDSCINLNGKQIGEYKYDTSDMKNTKWGKDNKQNIQSHDD